MKIGEVIKKWRAMKEINVRDVAQEIGISFATLCRIESGNTCDSETMRKLIQWLFANTTRKAAR